MNSKRVKSGRYNGIDYELEAVSITNHNNRYWLCRGGNLVTIGLGPEGALHDWIEGVKRNLAKR